jgi:TatD DNase family protein
MLDFHFHLDQYDGPDRILDEIEKNRITAVAVSTNLTSYVQTRLLTRGRRGVWVAVGFHPEEVGVWRYELDAVLEVVKLEPLIGEIGLDGKDKAKKKRTKKDMQQQRDVLDAILQTCDGCDKVLSIHSQDAVRPLLNAISQYDLTRVVWHWYVGNEAPLRQIIEMGHYLSVGPSIARKRSRLGRWIKEWVPRERILTETDGPHGERGKLRRDVLRSVLHTLAGVWRCSMEEAELQVQHNFERLIAGIPELSGAVVPKPE